MIKKFLDKLLGKPALKANAGSTLGKRVDVPKSEHQIDPAGVDERAA